MTFLELFGINYQCQSLSIVFVGAIVDREDKNNKCGLALVPDSCSKMTTELSLQFTELTDLIPRLMKPLRSEIFAFYSDFASIFACYHTVCTECNLQSPCWVSMACLVLTTVS